MQRFGQVLSKEREFPFYPGLPANHHMVGTGKAVREDDFAGKSAETPLHPVARDGVAHLLADRESHAHELVLVASIADEKHESGRGGTPSGICRQEIRAFLEDC
jgi:hypothetical protein